MHCLLDDYGSPSAWRFLSAWIADLRRLNFDRLLRREIPRGATKKDVEFSRTNIPIVKIGVWLAAV